MGDADEGRRGQRDVGGMLRAAFWARARSAVPDSSSVPPMSEPVGPAQHRSRSRVVVWAVPLAAAVVVAAVAVTIVVASHHNSTPGYVAAIDGPSTSRSAAASTTPNAPSTAPSTVTSTHATAGPKARVVRVTSDLNDGVQVGVGEPIVLNFSPAPTDSAAFVKAASITVNGHRATGAWYWEKPYRGQPIQAHYRQEFFWPAHATVRVSLPIGGLSAGKGLVYSGRLTSVTFTTGAAHVSRVDNATKQMTVTSDGRVVKTVPVSLGAATTPTYNGTKVVMQKGEDLPGSNTLRPDGVVLMSGPGYTGDPVPWSVRVTASGEYVHAAGWNTHIGVRDTSAGCTNLKPADGRWFYDFSQLGDVVTYTNTDGTPMNPLDGLGDWNIPWGSWTQGGLLTTR